jgi:hypothetical protein
MVETFSIKTGESRGKLSLSRGKKVGDILSMMSLSVFFVGDPH